MRQRASSSSWWSSSGGRATSATFALAHASLPSPPRRRTTLRAFPSGSSSGGRSPSKSVSRASLSTRVASSRSLSVLKRSFLRAPLDIATNSEIRAKRTSSASSWASASSLLAKATRVATRLSSGIREIACALTEAAVRARARSLPSGTPAMSNVPAPRERISFNRPSARTSSLPLTAAGAFQRRSSVVCRAPGSTRRSRSRRSLFSSFGKRASLW